MVIALPFFISLKIVSNLCAGNLQIERITRAFFLNLKAFPQSMLPKYENNKGLNFVVEPRAVGALASRHLHTLFLGMI